jgi:hypothetical protein
MQLAGSISTFLTILACILSFLKAWKTQKEYFVWLGSSLAVLSLTLAIIFFDSAALSVTVSFR